MLSIVNLTSKRLFSTSKNSGLGSEQFKKILRARKALKKKKEDKDLTKLEKVLNANRNQEDLDEIIRKGELEDSENEYYKLLTQLADSESQTIREHEGFTEILQTINQKEYEPKRDLNEMEIQVEDLQKEMSDDEFARGSDLRFIKPPRTQKEIKRVMEQVNDRYQIQKQMLAGNQKTTTVLQSEKKIERKMQNVPSGVHLERLEYPETQSEIILVGVEQKKSLHASYVMDLLLEMKPYSIFTQLPPDLPYFIRTDNNEDYRASWIRFIKQDPGSRFFVNPLPQYYSDVILERDKLKKFVGENIMTSDDFMIDQQFSLTLSKTLMMPKLQADAFMTGIQYAYHEYDNWTSVVIGDYPFLKYREDISRQFTISQIRHLFNQMVEGYHNQNYSFRPEILFKEHFFKRKSQYMSEVLRQQALSNKRIVALIDNEILDQVVQEWVNLDRKPQALGSFFPDNELIEDNEYEYKTILRDEWKPHIEQIKKMYHPKVRNESYVEFVEKHCMLDLMLEFPYITAFFSSFQEFPFDGREI